MTAENFDLEVIDLDDGPLLDDKEPLISDGNGSISNTFEPPPSDMSTFKCCPCMTDESQLISVPHKVRTYCTVGSCARSALRCFPFVRIIMAYNWRKNVLPDVIAGLTVGIMNIPQGMAYAILAELDPVVGLYVSFFAPVLYFIFGTSLQMSVGTFALASLMLADPVSRLAGDELDPTLFGSHNISQEAIDRNMSHHEVLAELRWEVALSVSLLVGLMQIGMGMLQLGFLAVFLSDALVSGFTTGAAIHVFTSQLPAVFGVKIPRFTGAWKLIKTYSALFVAISHTNLVTLALSGVSLFILILVRIYINPLVMRKIRFPIPVELLLVIVGTVVSYFIGLHVNWSVQEIGRIPSGFPPPRAPSFHLMPHLMLDAVTIAIFLFACTVSLAKIFSRKHKYALDANQEAFALGLTNVVIPFFGAYLAAGSLSRSMVQDEMGGKSQFAGLISSVLILIVLLAIGPLFSSVPNCILSCIILISLKGLFKQVSELPKLWKTSKYDFAIWVMTFLSTLLLDVGLGLLAGLAFSLLTVVARAHSFSAKLVTDIPNQVTEGSTQHSALPSVPAVPGTRLIRFEGPLYFGSAEKLRSHSLVLTGLQKSLHSTPLRLPLTDDCIQEAVRSPEITRCVILDCSRVTFVDSTGLRVIEELAEDLDLIGVELIVIDNERELLSGLSASRKENITISLSLVDSLKQVGRHYATGGTQLSGVEQHDTRSSSKRVAPVGRLSPIVLMDTNYNAGQSNNDDFDIVA